MLAVRAAPPRAAPRCRRPARPKPRQLFLLSGCPASLKGRGRIVKGVRYAVFRAYCKQSFSCGLISHWERGLVPVFWVFRQ